MLSRACSSLRPLTPVSWRHFSALKLPADSNQAQGIGQYAKAGAAPFGGSLGAVWRLETPCRKA